MRRRASEADPDASWSFLVFQLEGQHLVMVASLLRLWQWRVVAWII
jgi:hypothetical protein